VIDWLPSRRAARKRGSPLRSRGRAASLRRRPRTSRPRVHGCSRRGMPRRAHKRQRRHRRLRSRPVSPTARGGGGPRSARLHGMQRGEQTVRAPSGTQFGAAPIESPDPLRADARLDRAAAENRARNGSPRLTTCAKPGSGRPAPARVASIPGSAEGGAGCARARPVRAPRPDTRKGALRLRRSRSQTARVRACPPHEPTRLHAQCHGHHGRRRRRTTAIPAPAQGDRRGCAPLPATWVAPLLPCFAIPLGLAGEVRALRALPRSKRSSWQERSHLVACAGARSAHRARVAGRDSWPAIALVVTARPVLPAGLPEPHIHVEAIGPHRVRDHEGAQVARANSKLSPPRALRREVTFDDPIRDGGTAHETVSRRVAG
jgi:hypothetical protein